ncbi:MAG: SWIM zinc finger family protein [Pseudonocardiaceae bacterium]
MTAQSDDRVRGFPAFRPARHRPGHFARSWWGEAWLTAMEDTSLDPEQLRKGRRYAYAGLVGTITVSPGRIAAPVHDHDDTYRTVVLVEQLTAAEWERLLDEVAAKAGHIAALLDRDMPYDLVEAARDAGVRLLPDIGDLEPECSCPDWDYPCKHAAALCYQASWLLDSDPFVLLLMRGRGQRELLDELQLRNARQSPVPAERVPGLVPAGVAAQQAYALDVPPLPDPPPLPAAPAVAGGGQLLAVAPAPGVDPDALELLAADAAVRARELLVAADGTAEPPADLDGWQDTVRMAATHPRLLARLQRASGRSSELARAVRAWEYGGPAGLDVLEAAWSPPKADVARARTALVAAWEGAELPELRVRRNRWTVTGRGLQLRFGRDGRWYPYREESGEWWPAGPPERDPATALADLLAG